MTQKFEREREILYIYTNIICLNDFLGDREDDEDVAEYDHGAEEQQQQRPQVQTRQRV